MDTTEEREVGEEDAQLDTSQEESTDDRMDKYLAEWEQENARKIKRVMWTTLMYSLVLLAVPFCAKLSFIVLDAVFPDIEPFWPGFDVLVSLLIFWFIISAIFRAYLFGLIAICRRALF